MVNGGQGGGLDIRPGRGDGWHRLEKNIRTSEKSMSPGTTKAGRARAYQCQSRQRLDAGAARSYIGAAHWPVGASLISEVDHHDAGFANTGSGFIVAVVSMLRTRRYRSFSQFSCACWKRA